MKPLLKHLFLFSASIFVSVALCAGAAGAITLWTAETSRPHRMSIGDGVAWLAGYAYVVAALVSIAVRKIRGKKPAMDAARVAFVAAVMMVVLPTVSSMIVKVTSSSSHRLK